MRTFIQLRNGIGYATLITPSDAPDHSVTPNDTTAIEVFTENPDQFLNQRYDEATKSWSEAEVFIYGEVDENGRLIEIRKTFFENEAIGKPTITSEVRPDWLWINGKWVVPEIIDVQEVERQIGIDTTNETEEERLARVALASTDEN